MHATSAPTGLAGPTFDPDLIRRYDGLGPRYTSYPTADRFVETFGPEAYVHALDARNDARPAAPLSLYLHIPFCDTICYYCACNKIITRNRAHAERYVGYLAREIRIVGRAIEGDPPVSQVHWGGGTPTFLGREQMDALMESLRASFRFDANTEISIEVDPRKADAGTVAYLAELGFNRMSVGIQDFDAEVQQAVNRRQSEAETRAVIDAARAHGFASMNVDLIYGLPRQSPRGFAVTLDKVIDAAPDRVALYSYAHLPHLFKGQRQILIQELPTADVKLEILALAIERLTAAGYAYVGMDHFARPDDELAVAQREGKLHRNFQGYSTRPDCDLLGFGISAIGKVGRCYAQNAKTLDAYYAHLDADTLPTVRGIALSDDDVIRRDVIQRLMCDFALDFRALGAAHGIDFAAYFAADLDALRPLADDGLVTLRDGGLAVTPRGRLLVRTIAMRFDRHLREAREAARYSRVI
jgi:oxygen-independent coproporphyrinogen-3 oxidase